MLRELSLSLARNLDTRVADEFESDVNLDLPPPDELVPDRY